MPPIKIKTHRGNVAIREAILDDASKFRELRLFALQESPVAFPLDYEETAKQPPGYWLERLEKQENVTLFLPNMETSSLG